MTGPKPFQRIKQGGRQLALCAAEAENPPPANAEITGPKSTGWPSGFLQIACQSKEIQVERPFRSCLSVLSTTVVLAVTTSTLAQTQSRVFTPQLAVSLRTVTDVSLDPTGQRVAYVLSVPRDEDDEPGSPYSEIWLCSLNGGDSRRYTPSKGNSTSPQWSPDGKTIAFLSARDDEDSTKQIYVIAVDGGEASALTSLLRCGHAPGS